MRSLLTTSISSGVPYLGELRLAGLRRRPQLLAARMLGEPMVRRPIVAGSVAAYAIACTAILNVASAPQGGNEAAWLVLSLITLGAAAYLAAVGALFVAYTSGLLLALSIPAQVVTALGFIGFALVFALFGLLLWVIFAAIRAAVVSLVTRVRAGKSVSEE